MYEETIKKLDEFQKEMNQEFDNLIKLCNDKMKYHSEWYYTKLGFKAWLKEVKEFFKNLF